MIKVRYISFMLIVLVCFACNQESDRVEEKQPAETQTITDTTSFANNVAGFSKKEGIVGIFNIPEMLVLSILDSARASDISAKLVRNYAILEEELNVIGAELNGPVGVINYSNDPGNFKFECILCIKKIPAKQPARCNIVVLEASHMLVFNFYGPYQHLFSAYDKLKKYCKKNDLLQSGPMREFYMTDPETEKDPKKWLTRIMLPVIPDRKK